MTLCIPVSADRLTVDWVNGAHLCMNSCSLSALDNGPHLGAALLIRNFVVIAVAGSGMLLLWRSSTEHTAGVRVNENTLNIMSAPHAVVGDSSALGEANVLVRVVSSSNPTFC